ncbi:MAG: AAA family ATPase [Gemmatimonadetes bacterium]|nr:AAA family ATPase [Gemmatimonadota bacterium]
MIEVIGPAGAGKTMLVRRLAARHLRGYRRLALWGLPLLRLAAHALRLAPTWLGTWREGRPLSWAEFAQMTRLAALHEVVTRRKRRGDGLIVLDEGPVFGLSWFRVFFPQRGESGAFERWRARLLERWAASVDAIVFLDTSDAVLVRRVRTRTKPHMVKEWPDADIHRFNASFRIAFEQVLAELGRGRGPDVLRYRITGDERPDDVAGGVLVALEGERNGR